MGKLNKKHRSKILHYARNFAESEDDYKRDRAIIVLGWIGTLEDTDIFRQHLLQDKNSKCRAWSALSYMQMWFKNENDSVKLKVLDTYLKALNSERDYFVVAIILSAIRVMGKTKNWVFHKRL